MSQADEDVFHRADHPVLPAAAERETAGHGAEASGFGPAIGWLQRRPVQFAAVILIAAQVVWRAQFLGHLYFFREDFFNLDLARESPLSWHYLTFVGSGHLMIGERAIIWALARMSFYNWGLAVVVTLAFVLAADIAAFRALRTMFGERPAILVPLLVYLITPLTVADLGWWTAALEGVPLQFALFMAVEAHIRFVRTGQRRPMLVSFGWVLFGFVFFEKALVLPLLLFLVTSAFAAGGGSWLTSMRQVLVRYWRLWAGYGVVIVSYAAILAVALKTSTTQPQAPHSLGGVVTFTWNLFKDTFVPGALGGPWRWLVLPGQWYGLAAPPAELAWLALIVAIAIAVIGIIRRPGAWRSWAILAVWVVLADMAPIVVSRLYWYPILLAMDSRYVADAAPVLAICLGLAFLPLADAPAAAVTGGPVRRMFGVVEQRWRTIAAGILAVVVLGSIGSTQSYQSQVSGAQAASFIANATQAITLAPKGTPVIDSGVPQDVTYQAADAMASRVIGDIDPGKLRWLTEPDGSFNNLMMFGSDGRLHLAQMYGMGSKGRPAGRSCWPRQGSQIVVPYGAATPQGTKVIRFGYLWYSRYPGTVSVSYGGSVKQVTVEPGLNGAYVPEHGSAGKLTISGLGKIRLCVGDAEAGILLPGTTGTTIPPAVP